jgi:hypothetical protein
MVNTTPIVAFDGLTYEVCLYSFGREAFVKHVFGDHSLSVCVATKDDLFSFQLAQLNWTEEDQFDYEINQGRIYYLCATPHDAGSSCLVRLRDETEAVDLRKAISAAEAAA